jgi:hypothetical protein
MPFLASVREAHFRSTGRALVNITASVATYPLAHICNARFFVYLGRCETVTKPLADCMWVIALRRRIGCYFLEIAFESVATKPRTVVC